MKKNYIADLTLLFVTFIWGSTFVVVQNAIAFLEPHSFNSIRFIIAAISLGLWLVLFKREQLNYINKKIIFAGFLLGFWLFIGYAFQTMGLQYTTSSKAGFITGLSVVLVPLFSFFILKNKPKIPAIIGVIIATIGLYLLTMTGTNTANIGDILILICAIGFALQIVYTGKYTQDFPALLLTTIQICAVAIFSSICAFFFEDWRQAVNPAIILKSEVMMALFITSLLATAFAFLAQTYFQKFTTATHTALIFAMEPVFAAITGIVWVGETLSMSGFIGSAFILAGMLLSEMPINMRKSSNTDLIEKTS